MASMENLKHYYTTDPEQRKFEQINSMSEEEWEKACCCVNDCSVCDMAIHQFLLTVTKHVCVYGMTKEQFESAMDNADCAF